MTLSATAGGAALTASAAPTFVAGTFASITFTAPLVVGSVREWSFEITRAEIDVTSIGQAVTQKHHLELSSQVSLMVVVLPVFIPQMMTHFYPVEWLKMLSNVSKLVQR